MTISSPKPIALETRWRAASPELKAFIERLTASLLAEEDGQGLRQRKRRAADQEKFERAVEAICCNFAAAALAFGCDGPALAVQFAAHASSNSPVYGAHFKLAVRLLVGRGLITVTTGYRHSKFGRAPSTIRPTARYWLEAAKLETWQGLRLDALRELIRINVDDNKRRTLPPQEWARNAQGAIATINEHLKSIALGFDGQELFVNEMEGKLTTFLSTPQHRTVHRVFKGSIQHGGRLYAGVWETMPREDRFKLLTINDEPVVNVDFGQLFLRLAYALSKQLPPPGDLYDLMGGTANHEQTPARRDAIKRMVNALFSAKKPLKQWPGGTGAERSQVRDAFLKGTKPSDVVRATKEKHSAIAAEWFEQGRGLELHRLESDILIAVMLRLIGMGVSALPMHDSVIVARSDGERSRAVMLEEALRITGADFPVKIEGG